MDKIYISGSKMSGIIDDPASPEYTFPKEDYDLIEKNKGSLGYVSMIIILLIFFALSILGYVVETRKLGDKENQSSMVEAIEEEQPDLVSIEAKKKMWALVIYSFSATRNF